MDYEVLIDYMLDMAQRPILVEQKDGKQYVLKQPAVLTSNYQSVAQPKNIEKPFVTENLKLLIFVQSKYGIEPIKEGHVQLVRKKDDGSLEFTDEYEIGTIVETIVEGKLLGYLLYCNTQEVRKYVKD